MDQKFGQDLEIMRAILNYLIPHVHYEKVIVVVNQLLAYFVKLRQEFKALIVD